MVRCQNDGQDAVTGTLIELLEAMPPDSVALVIPETRESFTYGALLQQVEAMASALAANGITRTDRIAIVLANGLPMVVALLAAAATATAAPLNPAYKEHELRFFLRDTGATVLLLQGDSAEARRAAGSDIRVFEIQALASAAARLPVTGSGGRVVRRAESDAALMLHTSGSTGSPKRVSLTHASMVQSARQVAASYDLTARDVSFCVMPLFHVHGLVASTLATFATGGQVILPQAFSPLSFWQIARAFEVTWFSAVPAIHQMLLARTRVPGTPNPAPASLRFIRSCSAPLAPATMHALEAAYGVPVVEAYGMTEAAHQIATNPLPPLRRLAGTVGRAAGVEVRVLDARDRDCPPGLRGEVVLRGQTVIAGYDADAAVNDGAFAKDGWFRTGDEGFLDADRYLTLTGRLKEIINRGGEKVSPREIDEVLSAHNAVADAVCFGIAHPIWGEEIAAAVVVHSPVTEAELLAHCRQHLADFKCPKQICFAASLPRTATGKTPRQLIAQAFAGR
jgi:acyl-CoA synthetase (AMP-forming)/AMP-acid ligase II